MQHRLHCQQYEKQQVAYLHDTDNLDNKAAVWWMWGGVMKLQDHLITWAMKNVMA